MRGIKLLSVLLAVFMVCSLGAGVFAEELAGDPESFTDAAPEEDLAAGAEQAEETGEEEAAPANDAAAEEEQGDEYITLMLYGGEFGCFGDISVGEMRVQQVRGSTFQPVEVTPITDSYLFEGWYTGLQGRGERITEETVIDTDGMRAIANWIPNTAVIPVIEEDTVYALDLTVGGTTFSFTPEETAMYEICTMDNIRENAVPSIRLLDDRLITLENSTSMDNDWNAVIYTELTAGTTYYIEFSTVFGEDASYNAVLRRRVTVPVTFHANPETAGEAYFDGDPSVTEKTVEVRKGARIETYKYSGLELEGDLLELTGWTVDPEGEEHDEEIIADGPMDVYAVYHRYKAVILDTNGGEFPSWYADRTQYYYRYTPGDPFESTTDPAIEDSSLSFAGWATTPDAEMPDVIDGLEYDDLGDVLYAVYNEVVTVAFDANGGYMFINPDMKTFQTTYGKGHIFYSTHAEYDDPQVELIGWEDQNGEVIPHTGGDWPDYKYMEDTYLTAQWGKYIVADANGACFRFDKDLTALALLFKADEPFTNNRIIELTGEPINFDDMQYLAGWATTPDATEPDVIEGETDVMGLTRIYAVWKDDSYYLAEGGNQSWEKGGAEGLRVVVKRTGDDTMTFPCFTGVKIDGEQVTSFKRDEGSLILTILPEYLETLKTGEHVLRIEFTAGASVETNFKITEKDRGQDKDQNKDQNKDKNQSSDKSGSRGSNSGSSSQSSKSGSNEPGTGDSANAVLWSVILGIFAAGAAGTAGLTAAQRKKNSGVSGRS